MSAPGRRGEVLALLRGASAPMTIAQVAERLGVHVNTARFHLDALTERGLAEPATAPRNGPGRPPLAFRARRRMDRSGPRRYELLAGVLVRGLAATRDGSRRAAELGRDWGRQLGGADDRAGSADAATDRLLGLLDDLGFAPERRTVDDQTQIGLRHCPFLELAEHQREVVCPVHLGLMQGAMERLSDEVTVTSLEPFVEPDLCLTRLGER
jgi:predicted ArsR family transcriptional regulator